MKDLKSFFNRRKNIGLLTLLCLFAIGAYIVTSQNQIPLHDGDVLVDSRAVSGSETDQNIEVVNSDQPTNDYKSNDLKDMRAQINLERNKVLDTLNQTIGSSASSSEVTSATQQRDKLLTYIEQEMEIENIIKTKKLPECIALITDNSVTITVDAPEVDQKTATSICALTMKQTNRPANEIIVQRLGE